MEDIKLKIADFIIYYNKAECELKPIFEPYFFESDKYDCKIFLSDKQIEDRHNSVNGDVCLWRDESYLMHTEIAEWLPLHNAFLLHSVAFDVNGVGVAFAAHSGTGKTTHTMLWQQLLGDKMTIVNGDKPIVRFFDSLENAPDGTETGVPYAYGTPWNGKEHLGCNMRTPLKHICFIERSETNYVEKISANDAVDRIFNQVYMPQNPEAMLNTMQLINRLINSCELWIIHCNMDISAAQTAYNEIFK